MAPDFLEQLADADVPPPPSTFGEQLHERMNRGLLATQIIELATAGFSGGHVRVGPGAERPWCGLRSAANTN